MGAWGTGILQNDTTLDIWGEFKYLYNKGLSPFEIRTKLEKEYSPQTDFEYYSEIWTGIAYGQWMCGEVDDYTIDKVNNITNLKWLSLWEEDQKLLKKRINALSAFIQKIQTPRPTKLKRKKIVDRPSLFKTGDVIGIKINSDQYLLAIVIEHDNDPTDGANTIVLTDKLFKDKLKRKEILKSNILYLDMGGKNNFYRGFFCRMFSARNMAKKAKDIILIDNLKKKKYFSLGFRIKVDDRYKREKFLRLGWGIGIGFWNNILELYFEQIEFLKKNKSRKPFDVTVANLIKPNPELESKLIEWDKIKSKL